jgi:HK97 family phage portal protein
MGFPTTIEWMPPNLVWIDEDENSPVPNPMKVKYYYKGRFIPTEDILHLRAFTLPGKVRGVSPMKAFMLLVSQGLSMQKYGQDWFANGGFPPGVFKNTQQTVDETQSSAIKGKLVSAIRRHEPLVIGADWDYNVIVVPPEQAQFVASTQMNATQIAAIYGIPAERIGGSRGNALTYTTVEQNSIELLTETLRPWMVRLECAFFGMLPARRYVRFNADAMIRTDTLTRHQIFQIDREIGMKPIDELRAIDDLEPLPNGAGTDNRPLGVIEQMARTTGVVPENVYGAPVDDVLNPPTAATPTAPAQGKTVGTMSPLAQLSANGKAASNGKAPSASLDKPSNASQAAPKPPGTPSEPKLTPPGKSPKSNGLKPTRSLEDVARTWAGEQMSDHQMAVLRAEVGMFARRGGMEVGSYDAPMLDNGQFAWLLSMCRATEKPAEYAIIDSSMNGNHSAPTGGR